MKILLFILLLIILLTFNYKAKIRDNFITKYGLGFARFYNPIPACSSCNDCYAGAPARFTYYENMCEPYTYNSHGKIVKDRLLRNKRQLKDNCLRKL